MTVIARTLKPSLLFVAGSIGGTAQAATILNVNYTPTSGGTAINIGGNATAQYSFSYTNKIGTTPGPKGPVTTVKGSTATLAGNGGATVTKNPSQAAFYPDAKTVTQASTDTANAGNTAPTGKGNGYYGLLFDINGVAQTGYALVTDGPAPAGSSFSAGPGLRISEIGYQAVSPTAVPEPETWAMMIVGMGGVGMMMRRRRRAQATAAAVA